MENEQKQKKLSRARRIKRVRKRIRGNSLKPRLNVYKSNKHFYAQLIDDEKSSTLAFVTTRGKEKKSVAKLGEELAGLAKEKKIDQVVFDRGRFKYHGILVQFADAARKNGLKF